MRINPTSSSPEASALEKKNLGRIAQIIGPVLDVAFSLGKMPKHLRIIEQWGIDLKTNLEWGVDAYG